MKIFKILSPLLLLITIFINGCGSNSKAGPVFDNPNTGGSTEVNGYKLVNITVPFDVHYANEAKNFKVQLLQNGVPVIGAKIQVAGLPAEFGVVTKAFANTDDSGYATFNYIASDPLINGVYSLDVFYDGEATSPTSTDNNSTQPFRIKTQLNINVQESNGDTPNGGGKINYSLVNTTNPFLVTYVSEEKSFGVQVLKGGIPIKDQDVSVATLPSKYGTISPATAKSNDAGYAIFNYLAPDPLTNGTYDLELSHTDENGSKVTNSLHIQVDKGAQEFTYQLTNASTPIILSEPNQKGFITVYLVDKTGVGVAGKTVNISILDNAYGVLTATVATTDSSGKASFEYTASSDIVGLGSTVLTASFTENGLSTTQNIEVKSESTFDYKLTNLTTPLMVTAPLQESSITIQLVNKANQPIVGKDISLTAIDIKYGSITPAVAKTDASGTAKFTYTAPDSLLGLTNTQSTLTFTENGLSVSDTLTIAMALDFDYKLTNLTTPIMVKTPSEKQKITVQLVDKNNQGVVGKDIGISALDVNYGFITPTVSTTNDSGTAVFEYTAPSSLIGLSNTQSTVSFTESDLTISEVLTVSVQTAFNYKFSNPTTPLIVQAPKQESEVGVYLVDSNGLGIPDKDVSVTTIDSAYGSISPTTIKTDKSGRAIYKYLGPDSLSGLKNTFAKFSFTESDLTIYSDMEIKVSANGGGTDYKLTNSTTPVSIIKPEESKFLEVQLVRNGLPVIDARPCPSKDTVTIDCVMPEAIPKSYGRITDAGGSTTKSGYVNFDYLGPKEMDKADVGTEHIFNIIYFDAEGKPQASTPITIQMNF